MKEISLDKIKQKLEMQTYKLDYKNMFLVPFRNTSYSI